MTASDSSSKAAPIIGTANSIVDATGATRTLGANGLPDDLIAYPSDFPIKVLGPTHDDFHDVIVDLVTSHDPEFHPGRVDVRPSSKGNYTALTITVNATSREQLDNLYRALTSHPMVKYVL